MIDEKPPIHSKSIGISGSYFNRGSLNFQPYLLGFDSFVLSIISDGKIMGFPNAEQIFIIEGGR
jgi:hypothetical protein